MTAVAAVDPIPARSRFEWPYRFEIVPLEELSVDGTYQRPLTSFWKEVSSNFNPALVGTLIVSERKGGKKSIIDGQTRWEAMKGQQLPGAPCLIYERLSKPEEAELFADLQTKRRGMRTFDRFRAQLVAKRPEAVAISHIVEAAGFELSVHETPNTMKAIAALEKLYRFDGDGGHLADVLGVIKRVWGTQDAEAVAGAMLTGLSSFLRHQKGVDYDRLEKRLRDVTPRLVLNRAAQIREGAGLGTGSAKSVATAIMQEYMRRR